MRDHLDFVLDEASSETPAEFGFGMKTHSPAIEEVGYYDKPVPVTIPKLLEPLPDKLLENPMNLLVSTLDGQSEHLLTFNSTSYVYSRWCNLLS